MSPVYRPSIFRDRPQPGKGWIFYGHIDLDVENAPRGTIKSQLEWLEKMILENDERAEIVKTVVEDEHTGRIVFTDCEGTTRHVEAIGREFVMANVGGIVERWLGYENLPCYMERAASKVFAHAEKLGASPKTAHNVHDSQRDEGMICITWKPTEEIAAMIENDEELPDEWHYFRLDHDLFGVDYVFHRRGASFEV